MHRDWSTAMLWIVTLIPARWNALQKERMCHSPSQKPLSAPLNSLKKQHLLFSHPKFSAVSRALQEKAPQPLSFLFSHPSGLVSKAQDKQLP